MKKYLFLLIFPLLVWSCGPSSKVSRADQPWSYEVESMGVGADGTYAIRIWSWWRNANMPVETAKKNAVHAVIFRGVPAGNGAAAQPALKTGALTPAETAFFDNFFLSEYQRYINSVASGSIQVLKTGRNEYKIGYVVSVSKDSLRKYLEDNNMIKKLSSGF